MIRTLALLGLFAFATPVFGASEPKLWNENLSYKFDMLNGFHFLPLTIELARAAGWIQIENPVQHSGFSKLTLWILKGQRCNLIALFFDENEQVAGIQINQPEDQVNSYYDREEQGFNHWTHNSVDFASIAMFWVSEDSQTRIASYNATKVLRNDYLTVASFNGRWDKIPTNCKNLDPIWTKQACIPLMGQHYYYNMTQSLPCDKCFHPWFPLCDVRTNQLIGLGFMYLGLSGCEMEQPSTAAVKMIVPTGPQCLFDMVDKHHASTIHSYFVDRPRFISC